MAIQAISQLWGGRQKSASTVPYSKKISTAPSSKQPSTAPAPDKQLTGSEAYLKLVQSWCTPSVFGAVFLGSYAPVRAGIYRGTEYMVKRLAETKSFEVHPMVQVFAAWAACAKTEQVIGSFIQEQKDGTPYLNIEKSLTLGALGVFVAQQPMSGLLAPVVFTPTVVATTATYLAIAMTRNEGKGFKALCNSGKYVMESTAFGAASVCKKACSIAESALDTVASIAVAIPSLYIE